MLVPSEIVNTVLIVDDDPDETAELTTRLEHEGKVVLKAKDDREAREILGRIPCLDVVILDLFLDGVSPSQAQIVLRYIEENYMVPVFIYKKHLGEGSLSSPNIIGVLTKSDGIEKIQEQIAKLLGGARFIRIALAWARSVSIASHKTLVTLMPGWAQKEGEYNNTLALLLAGMRSDRRGDANPDLEASDLIRILTQGLFHKNAQDQNLLSSVKSAIVDSGNPDFKEKSDYWKFREIIQYSHPSTELCTGDLFRNDKDGSLLVLISPQCDLVDSEMEALCCLRAFPLHEFLPTVRGDKDKRMSILHNRTLRYHSLPAGNDSGRSLILDFASVFTVKRSHLTSGEFTKTATIVSPFRENLVQRYVTYVNRIGTPDIHEKILEKLHDTIVNDRRGT